MIIRNKKTGEIREISENELNQYGLGGQLNKLGVVNSLWNNIRANVGSGKRPTKKMLNQERKIKNQHQAEYGMEVMGNGGLIKYQEGKEVVNPNNPIQLKEIVIKPELGFEQKVDRWLGNPMAQAERDAEVKKWFNPKTKKWEREDPIDNVRHTSAGRYVAEAIANKTGNIPYVSNTLGYLGSNLLGAAHEASTYFVDDRWNDKKSGFFNNFKVITRTGLEDLYNNNIGAMIGVTPFTPSEKTRIIKNLSNNNLIPDGYGEADPFHKGIKSNYKQGGQKMPPELAYARFAAAGNLNQLGRYGYQDGGDVPTVQGTFKKQNQYGYWVTDEEALAKEAQRLNSKRVLTEEGSLIIFDDNWNIVAADDNPDAPYKQGGSVTLNAGGENHRIYVKTTNRGEGEKGHIMVNHPTMDKGMWDTIDLTQKSGARTIAQGVAATKKWHKENPYMKEYGGDIPMYAYGGLTKYQNKGEIKFNPFANANRVSSNDGTKVFRLNANQVENAKKEQAMRASVEQKFLNNIKIKAAEERKRLAAKKLLPSGLKNMAQIINQENYIKRAEGSKAKQPYAIVDKIGNVIRYYDVNHNMVKEENVITGESNKDVDKELSWDEFMRAHPTANKNAYIDYLQATNNKITPAGLFKLHYKDDVLENPSTKGKIADMIIPGHKQKTIDARSHTYGNSGKMFTFASQYGIPSSKAIHGTGYEDRLAAFINGTDRNLSNGCINVDGKTICFDFLKEGSNLYVLPEEQGANNIVTFKPALSSNSGRIDPTRSISRERVNEIRQTKKNFNNINKAANLGMTDRELNFATSVAEKESKGGRSIGSKMESNLLPGTIASSYGKFEMKEGFPWLKGGNPNNDTVALKAVRDFYREKNSDNFEHSDNFSDENFNNEDINNARMYTEYNTGKSNPDAIWGEDYLKNLYPLTRYNSGGGIPERYRNMGFTNVGAKKQSTRPGKKWMVLAKKGDDYKVVHGGYKGMQDFKQHHSEQRKENFWSRMGGRNSSKATDPFSPLYWHKRFGTWEQGGQIPIAQNGVTVNIPNQKIPYVNYFPGATGNSNNYTKAAKYLARDVFKGAPLKANDIATAIEKFKVKTGYDYPLDLLLAQAQQETHFGKELKSKHNYFNVGNDDDGNVINFASPEESFLNYMDLVYNDYLQKGKKDYHNLLVDNGYVNYAKKRYAKDPLYEKKLRDQSQYINRFLNKNKKGGQYMAIGGQNVMNPIVKKDNRNWLEYLKN